ncbi:MAG: hypothetical protein ABIS38_02995 [Sphingomicrobium sp.]
MSRHFEPKKSTVELAPSRIRRDPVSSEKRLSLFNLSARSRGWEMGLAIAGMVVFALALNALWFGVNAFLID